MGTYLSTANLIAFYAILRLFSFFFGPITPLQPQSPVNTALALIIAILTAYLMIKNDERGWYLVTGELILGGAGGFLSIGPLALRSALLIISASVFYFQSAGNGTLRILYNENKKIVLVVSAVLAAAGLAATRGIIAGHEITPTLADFVPYLFLLYILPLLKLWPSENFKKFAWRSIVTTIVCNLIFVFFTAAGFSSGIFALQGAYYHWFRDVALGKITEIDSGFFRIVLNEHLLLTPVFLIFLHQFFVFSKRQYLWVALAILPIMAINFTRIYWLAAIIGIIFLFRKNDYKRRLIWCAAAGLIFLLSFIATHFAFSREHTLGLDLLGLRLRSVAEPTTENSALSRLILLPNILDKIRIHPILGSGLGDTVTAYSPILKQNITTPNFDWGYLEIMAEMGLPGVAAWILLIMFIGKTLWQNYGLAPLAALLAINLTSPALFHALGIIMMVCLLSAGRACAKSPPWLPDSGALASSTKATHT